MHSQKTIQQFIKLRSRSYSLHDISERLRVPRSTLGDWNARYFLEISTARAANWERIEAAAAHFAEHDLFRVLGLVERAEHELARRDLTFMKDSDLIRLFCVSRREYFRRRDRLMAPLERPRPSSKPLAEAPVSITPEASNGHGQKPNPRNAAKYTAISNAVTASVAVHPRASIRDPLHIAAPNRCDSFNGFSRFQSGAGSQNRKKPDENRTTESAEPADDIASPTRYT
ncbi:MAG: hypothetical protein L0Y58_11740 [Verrucomicrobia subdivision 3 bacterium]|nr:hypothetical protein [Limisphaerales bacterium]